MPPRSYQAGRFTWVFPCLKSLAPLGSRLPALSRSRSRRAPFIKEGETLDGATAIVTGAGRGSPYSFTVASRAALADPAKAAAIRDYLSLLAQAHRWASTHLSAWAAVWAQASGLPSAVMRKAAAGLRCARGTRHARRGRLRAAGRRRVHRQHPDPGPRELQPVRRRVIQRNGECLMRKDAP